MSIRRLSTHFPIVRTVCFISFLILSGCSSLPSPEESGSGGLESVEIQSSLHRTVNLTHEADDIFQRIRNGFSMPDIDDDLVIRHQQNYLGRPDNLRRMVERSRPYLHHIVEEIGKRGMPMELALLPIVESAYNPMAYSRAKASGLWQFIPTTGRHYKLGQNWWQDERRDIIASTAAALDYFETLYEMHGDWHLALASYNWGGGAVGRAIARNQSQGLPTDYLNLATMPEETKNYVPKLQALKNIFRDSELISVLNISPIPNRPYFTTIDQTPGIDVKLAAKLADLTEQEFIALNPSHNRPVIVSQSPLLLPEDRVETFINNFKAHIEKKKPLTSWQIYTLREGEQLDQVAQRFGMTLANLKNVNDIGKRSKLRPGLSLLVAGNKGGEPLNEKILARSLQFPESDQRPFFSSGRFYTIRKGDTLLAIAGWTGLSVNEIKRWNNMRGNTLIAGKKLILQPGNPSPRKTLVQKLYSTQPTTPVGSSMNYTIRPGDTLSSIAKQFRIAVSDLMRWNRVSPKSLKPGQTLTILLAKNP